MPAEERNSVVHNFARNNGENISRDSFHRARSLFSGHLKVQDPLRSDSTQVFSRVNGIVELRIASLELELAWIISSSDPCSSTL